MILSGGVGSRFESDIPKQYNILLEKEIISYSIDAIKGAVESQKIIVLCDCSYSERISKQYDVICVECGNTRNSSLKNGLDYMKTNFPECDRVFITEAARPFLTSRIERHTQYGVSFNPAFIHCVRMLQSHFAYASYLLLTF